MKKSQKWASVPLATRPAGRPAIGSKITPEGTTDEPRFL